MASTIQPLSGRPLATNIFSESAPRRGGRQIYPGCMAIAPNGSRLAIGCEEGSILEFDLPGGRFSRRYGDPVDLEVVFSLIYTPDSRRLVSTCGGTIRIWDTATGQLLSQTANPLLRGAVLASAGGIALASDADARVVLWDVKDGHERSAVYLRDFSPHRMDLTQDEGEVLVSGICGSGMVLLDVADGVERWRAGATDSDDIDEDVECATFLNNDEQIVTGSDNGRLRLWNARTGKELTSRHEHLDRVNGVAQSPNGLLLASGSLDDSVRVWTPSLDRALAVGEGDGSGVACIAIAPNSSQLYSTSYNCELWSWELSGIQNVNRAHGEGGVLAYSEEQEHPEAVLLRAIDPGVEDRSRGIRLLRCMQLMKSRMSHDALRAVCHHLVAWHVERHMGYWRSDDDKGIALTLIELLARHAGVDVKLSTATLSKLVKTGAPQSTAIAALERLSDLLGSDSPLIVALAKDCPNSETREWLVDFLDGGRRSTRPLSGADLL